jgi:hypothetical protein
MRLAGLGEASFKPEYSAALERKDPLSVGFAVSLQWSSLAVASRLIWRLLGDLLTIGKTDSLTWMAVAARLSSNANRLADPCSFDTFKVSANFAAGKNDRFAVCDSVDPSTNGAFSRCGWVQSTIDDDQVACAKFMGNTANGTARLAGNQRSFEVKLPG